MSQHGYEDGKFHRRSRLEQENFEARMTLVLLALFVVGALWWRLFAPCSWHGFEPVYDLPARCVRQAPVP